MRLGGRSSALLGCCLRSLCRCGLALCSSAPRLRRFGWPAFSCRSRPRCEALTAAVVLAAPAAACVASCGLWWPPVGVCAGRSLPLLVPCSACVGWTTRAAGRSSSMCALLSLGSTPAGSCRRCSCRRRSCRCCCRSTSAGSCCSLFTNTVLSFEHGRGWCVLSPLLSRSCLASAGCARGRE